MADLHPLKWLTENIGLVTLVVGGFAIFLYLKQKRDYKSDSANLIVQEIRYAEQQIRNYRDSKSYPLSSTILPSNSWHKNINLFVNNLNESDIDIISRFYSQANYIGILINKISDLASAQIVPAEQIGPEQTPPPPQLPNNQAWPGQPTVFLRQVIQVAGKFKAQAFLDDVSEKIEFVYNTPAVDKLRTIAAKRWYEFWI